MLSSIRARLLLLMMTVLLPGMAAALFMVERTYQSERDAVQRGLRDSALAMSQVVDRELARRADIATALANSHLMTREPDVDPDMSFMHAWCQRIVKDLGGWIQLVSATHVLVDTRHPPGSPPHPLEAGDFTALSAVPMVAPMVLGPSGEPRPPLVVQPAQRPGGVPLNVVIAVPFEVLQRAVDHQRLPADWVGTVLDNTMRVAARHPGGAAYVGRLASPDMLELLARHERGAFTSVSLDGVPTLGYFSKTPQGWTYLAAARRETLLAGLPPAAVQVLGGALLLLAVAAGGALWVGRGIARAVGSLEGAAQALKAGAPAPPPPHTGIAELDAVGATLSRAAHALDDSRHELERQVAEAVSRTRQAEQRVSQGQRIAALGRLTGGVAHDFNNLLGVISNSAHLIEHHVAQVPALEMPVAVTLRAVETGSHLSQQLLRFGGRQPVSPRRVDLATHLPGLRELLQMVVRRSISVGIEVQPGLAPVEIDTGELELALLNVAFNARDAMPHGGQLRVQARKAHPHEVEGLPPGNYVTVAVTDTGLGMDEAVAARVFEPFYTTKEVGAGNGLGLSQVYGFCTQAGGTARMASTPGLGSTVLLVLPAREAQVAGPAATDAALPQDGPLSLDDTTLLLVEDSEELAEVTALLLQSYGAQVRRARDVQDALAQVATDPTLQLVLTDVVMPGGRDGVDLARELRRTRPDLPVVLISGYSAALTGLTGFTVLRKPVAADQLVRTLRAARDTQAPAGMAGGA